MSKTLDSASAHFAASAVVSAPVPSRSEGSKEQNTGHNNMNGVVQPSGTTGVSVILINLKLPLTKLCLILSYTRENCIQCC